MTNLKWTHESDGASSAKIGEHLYRVIWNGKAWVATESSPAGFRALGTAASYCEAELLANAAARVTYPATRLHVSRKGS